MLDAMGVIEAVTVASYACSSRWSVVRFGRACHDSMHDLCMGAPWLQASSQQTKGTTH